MCGEHAPGEHDVFFRRGSSPHVRGALRSRVGLEYPTGIIPACAGSTQTRRQNRRDAGDHPRMCGEHRLDALEKELAAGSSPHVRGAQGRQDRPGFRRGTIPACAGSTRGQRRFLGECRDHPRMCGEHAGHTCNGSLVQGSSPHVRGARTHEWTVRRFAGIIPACAGSTA